LRGFADIARSGGVTKMRRNTLSEGALGIVFLEFRDDGPFKEL
jgi:hypothetical protein